MLRERQGRVVTGTNGEIVKLSRSLPDLKIVNRSAARMFPHDQQWAAGGGQKRPLVFSLHRKHTRDEGAVDKVVDNRHQNELSMTSQIPLIHSITFRK